jgi:hypothetical protein
MSAPGSRTAGKALHTLIGYTDQPTAMQLAIYQAVLAVTDAALRCAGKNCDARAELEPFFTALFLIASCANDNFGRACIL